MVNSKMKSEMKSFVEKYFEFEDIEFLENGNIHISTNLNIKRGLEHSIIGSLCERLHQCKDGLYGLTVTNKSEYVTESIRRDDESIMYICFSKEPEGIPPYVNYYGCLIGGKISELIDAADKLESMDGFDKEEFIQVLWDTVSSSLYSKETLYDEVELPDSITQD
jgi:hypothetical protein